MECWIPIFNPVTAALGLLFSLVTVAVLILSKRPRDAVLHRMQFRDRRSSGCKTPPRSVSPEKQGSERRSKKASGSSCSTIDYVDSFPPSRRAVLSEAAECISATNRSLLLGPEPPVEFLQDHLLPMIQSYDLETCPPKYTPTGISTAEIKAMGDFSQYDLLSGVPLPQAYEGFDHTKAIPRPYRPFRWSYHQTMSLTKMEPDWWLELDNLYLTRLAERRSLYDQHGKQVLDYLPGSELACKELMEMSLLFYCARYPRLFSISDDKTTFYNKLTGEDTNLRSMHPLHVLLHNIPEDFAIVLRNETDGLYYFRAGVICSSLGWDVSTKIGMALKDIHKPIPDYEEKMAFSMDRFFSKMATNQPIQRGSWGLEVGTPLFMPPGHPHEKLREFQRTDLTVEECYLRVDWQTLRRLPLSAGIAFNYKALFTPVMEFRDESYIPALLLKILREGKKSLMAYKGTWHVEHVCIKALEKWADEQRMKGWVKADQKGEACWIVSTLNESPYFPGWEEKWHRQQGF